MKVCQTIPSTLKSYIIIFNVIPYYTGILSRTKKRFFRLIRLIPAVQRKIDKEIGQITVSMESDAKKRTEGMMYYTKLPFNGLQQEEIIALVDAYLALGEYKWKEGRVSGAVYNYTNSLAKLVAAVYEKTSYTNPLHPDIFPGINKMEAEVVRMSAALFRGDAKAVGTVIMRSIRISFVEIFTLFVMSVDDHRWHRVNYNGV